MTGGDSRSAATDTVTVGAGVELAATLTLPTGRGPHSAIVPLHPASDRSRDQPLFRHLAGTGHSPTIGDGDISPEYDRALLVWLDDRVGSKLIRTYTRFS